MDRCAGKHIDMGVDMKTDTCIDVCTNVCTDVYTDMCAGMHIKRTTMTLLRGQLSW